MNTCLLATVIGLVVASGAGGAEPPHDGMLIYGKGFAFGVKEPAGWHGETLEADKIAANVFFVRPRESASNAAALIRVRINKKTDEDIKADLRADMEGYRKEFRGVQFRDLRVSHPTYAVAAKLFFVPGRFYEYVAYINPGPGKPWMFAASMNKQKLEATPAELSAFRAVISSIRLF